MKTLKELLQNTPVTALHGDDSAAVAGLVYDSRAVGQGDCFFAVRGTQNDGHDFIPAAVAKGAAAVVCECVWGVKSDGSYDHWYYSNTYGVRPAFVLPSSLVVSDDGTVSTNTAPAINASSTNLGEKNAPFGFDYTVTDADGDTLTVTEKLDGKTTATRTGVASGTALTFGQGSTAENFQRILNGSHTIQITANDGKESTSLSATFTKSVTSATVTLTTPLAVDGDITVAVLRVTGSIPDDATFKAEVTNNANDPSPVWQDATEEVQKGVNIVFSNKTAANGAAFNFRISVARGASGTGGYIEAISGAFQ